MSEPLINAARWFTGKVLSGNPHTPTGSKQVMNTFNNLLYRR